MVFKFTHKQSMLMTNNKIYHFNSKILISCFSSYYNKAIDVIWEKWAYYSIIYRNLFMQMMYYLFDIIFYDFLLFC